jgi:hypothetical protein
MKKQKLTPKTAFFKTALLTILFAMSSFLPLGAPKTHAWLTFAGAQYKQLLERIDDTIKGVQLSIAKQAAMISLTAQVNSLVVGNSQASIMFITNWEDYLYKYPQNETNRYMNDYLSQISMGRGSRESYIASYEGFDATNRNYYQALVDIGKSSTIERPVPKITYEGDPQEIFAEGNFKNLSIYLSGINNPWGFDLNSQVEYQRKIEEQRLISQSKAVAYQGFIGSGEKGGVGITITPGTVIKETVANVQNIGNQIIAAAQHPEEIVSAVVSQMITQAIQQGIGEAQRIVNRELAAVSEKTSGLIDAQIEISGPGATYGYSPSIYSSTSSNSSSNSSQQTKIPGTGECIGKSDGTACNGSIGVCQGGLCWPKN